MYIHSIYSAFTESTQPVEVYKKMSSPDFSDIFEKNEMRRLSPLIKNGVGCGIKAYKDSNFTYLNGIITGTGKGSISKIEQFLRDIDTYHESALNPGIFIQSTHNTINGQLGLKLGYNTYNMTHVNQGFTFNNVLMDAQLILSEKKEGQVLAGFFEENTEFNVDIHQRSGLSGNLKNGEYEIIWGEGVSFFTLSNQTEGSLSKINDFKSFTNLNGSDHWRSLNEYCKSKYFQSDTLFLLGSNNEKELSSHYGEILELLNNNNLQFRTFKNRCGEFDTSSSYALKVAVEVLSKNEGYSKVIICNHFKDYVNQFVEISLP